MAAIGGGGVKIKRPSWWKQEYESLNSRRAVGLGSGGGGRSSGAIGGIGKQQKRPSWWKEEYDSSNERMPAALGTGSGRYSPTETNGIRSVTQRAMEDGSVSRTYIKPKVQRGIGQGGMATRWDPIKKRFIMVRPQPGMRYAL